MDLDEELGIMDADFAEITEEADFHEQLGVREGEDE